LVETEKRLSGSSGKMTEEGRCSTDRNAGEFVVRGVLGFFLKRGMESERGGEREKEDGVIRKGGGKREKEKK
jgi:hypothetical protein